MTEETPSRPDMNAVRASRNKTITRLLVALTLAGFAIFAGSAALVVYLAQNFDRAEVKEEGFLEVSLSGPLPEAPMVGGFVIDPSDIPPLVTEIAAGIRHASTDERITGILLDLDAPAASWAGLDEIRSSLVEFRKSGKPCVAYSDSYNNATYYLASACDQVLLAPSGIVTVIGLHAELTFYAGMFEKLGIEAEMLHVGDFKSAVEPYERTAPSEPAAAAMNYLLDGLYSHMVQEIAQSRGVSEDTVRGWIDTPALAAETALERGMVDGLTFRDSVRGFVNESAAEVGSENWLERVEAASSDSPELENLTCFCEYRKVVAKVGDDIDDKVAVIYAEGPIMSGGSESGGLFGSSGLTDGAFRSWMLDARRDDSVKAVVVRVNSPGGSGLASDMMWHEVELTKAAGKPVVISMAGAAASGGYFLAAPADWIVAQPSTLTGSIGVFGGKIIIGGTDEWTGLSTHSYKRGEQSDLFSMRTPFSDDSRLVYQGFLDSFYSVFLEKVSAGRGMSTEDVHQVAQGRVWTGAQALERKLVDELGGLDTAIAKAAELASLTEHGLVHLPKQKDFVELLMEDLSSVTSPTVQVPTPVQQVVAPLEDALWLETLFRNGDVAAMLPARIEIR